MKAKIVKSVNSPSTDKRIKKMAEKIKKLRQDAGYTSHESFAWDNELSRAQYWRLEKGANFTMTSLLRILDAHKISLKDFFSDFDL